jgi:hypothetical protein
LYEYWCRTRVYIVGVDGGGGEVVDPLVVGGVFDCGDLDVGAVGGLQVVAGVEVFRLDPLTGLGY